MINLKASLMYSCQFHQHFRCIYSLISFCIKIKTQTVSKKKLLYEESSSWNVGKIKLKSKSFFSTIRYLVDALSIPSISMVTNLAMIRRKNLTLIDTGQTEEKKPKEQKYQFQGIKNSFDNKYIIFTAHCKDAHF